MSYLIRNGLVIDGSGVAGAVADVRTKDNLIVEIGQNLAAQRETEIDAKGLIVCPGLIDLHAHVYDGTGIWAIDVNACGLKTGVTTLLDTGTAGSLNYQTFEKYVMPVAREEIYALLNISMLGCLQGHPDAPPVMGELADVRHIDAKAAIDCIQAHPKHLIGVKARLSASLSDHKKENEDKALKEALKAAEKTGTLLMIHHAVSNIPVQELLEKLRPGDIYTHLFHPHVDHAFEKNGKPLKVLLEAQARGVICDVGHGAGAFGWNVAEAACREYDFWPNTISTDIHFYNLDGPVWDMATTLSKFLYLGMPLEKVLCAATQNPAKAMGMADRIGTLHAGMQADIALLQLEEGQFELDDVIGEKRTSSQRLVAKGTLKNGQKYF
ncbi:MAG: amidohydrolase/deacetylase family metallohydrolase [Abditibacteriaceae bacterium]